MVRSWLRKKSGREFELGPESLRILLQQSAPAPPRTMNNPHFDCHERRSCRIGAALRDVTPAIFARFGRLQAANLPSILKKSTSDLDFLGPFEQEPAFRGRGSALQSPATPRIGGS